MKKKLLYICAGRSSFVENDLSILKQEYDIRVFVFKPKKKAYTPIVYLREFAFLARHLFSSAKIVCMFGGHHSVLPALLGRLFRRPCLIITGGTDCVSFPSINYGVFNKKYLGIITRWSYQLAAHIAPVHKSLVGYDYTYQPDDFPKQGIKYFCPELKTPITVINYGFDQNKWYQKSERKPNSFITVAAGLDKPYRVKLKGVDLILDAAGKLPEASFTIVGVPENYKLPVELSNVKAYTFIPNEKLKEFYNTHEFYIQVSMSEGFPNAICEAMCAGCIPVGSNVGGIPDIVDDAGFVLYKRDKDLFLQLLREAMNCNKTEYSEKARRRIAKNYPPDLREKQLLSLLKKMN